MKVKFNAANPRQKARPLIDEVLGHGVDQVAIACAFLTGGGAAILKKHASRLKLPDSFLVVAWEPPTTLFLDALEELHSLFPGNLYVHLGAQTPVEKDVGRGLMHSKVFLARAGDQCWLWAGSHNMTASAMQGVNREAAIVLEGSMSEPVFKDALSHLETCRQEAIVYDPYHPPPTPPSQQTLVIHAECHVALKPSPWFVHLMSTTTAYDGIMGPPASVWLYVYSPGTLASSIAASHRIGGVFWDTDRTELHRASSAARYSGRLAERGLRDRRESWRVSSHGTETSYDSVHAMHFPS